MIGQRRRTCLNSGPYFTNVYFSVAKTQIELRGRRPIFHLRFVFCCKDSNQTAWTQAHILFTFCFSIAKILIRQCGCIRLYAGPCFPLFSLQEPRSDCEGLHDLTLALCYLLFYRKDHDHCACVCLDAGL